MVYKVDKNQKEIIQAAKKMGASVQSLAMVGLGCPDILVGFKGKNYLFEIKDGSHMTFLQHNWHASWNGEVHIIHSIDDLIGILNP